MSSIRLLEAAFRLRKFRISTRAGSAQAHIFCGSARGVAIRPRTLERAIKSGTPEVPEAFVIVDGAGQTLANGPAHRCFASVDEIAARMSIAISGFKPDVAALLKPARQPHLAP
jgi:hypothetical protein